LEVRRLGRSGLWVSPLALGTMLFGSERTEAEAWAILDRAHELGLTLLDTADAYPFPLEAKLWGRTETYIGGWLRSRGHRSDVVVATKCANRAGPGHNDYGGSRKHVLEACDASLRRLGIDAIDLYYLHNARIGAPLDETLGAMDQLVRQGKVHYVGISNFEPWQLALAMDVIGTYHLAPVSAVTCRYTLLHRTPERELFPLAEAKGHAVVPYWSLGAGMLTGRHKRTSELPPGWRFDRGEWADRHRGADWADRVFDVAEAVDRVASAQGLTLAQVTVAWLLSHPVVTAPVVGVSRPEQLDELVAASEVRLPTELLELLDVVSEPFLWR
jgi:1-deoxyxylulose-5-phosphate synthase